MIRICCVFFAGIDARPENICRHLIYLSITASEGSGRSAWFERLCAK
ncbi:hypothetical protein PANA5342_pPANA10007 (plasmid) [Pantoea ananatis LMG 5342]|nr:hypothetical protein PANA5342_pPANA10007 [Pantoea ananatis LMG 5342]